VPIETAPFINGLNASNPAASDGMNGADDHMRLTKAAILATFPNISGAVTASHTQLNSILSQLLGTTIYNAPLGTVGAPGYAFAGDLDTGWYSPAANRAALSLGGVDALNFASDKTANFAAGASFAGAVSATGAITGPGTTPIGGMIMHTSNTLPTGHGVWCWANGGTLSRTTVGAGKELFDKYAAELGSGTFYGIGDGTSTFNVINMQEVVPVGRSGMGGATSPGLLASIATGVKDVLGTLFGADTKTLTSAYIPSLASSGTNFISVVSTIFDIVRGATTLTSVAGGAAAVTLGSSTAYSSNSVTSQANNSISVNYTNASPTALSLIQPSRAVNFIIRIA
jgi:hypothetical protein